MIKSVVYSMLFTLTLWLGGAGAVHADGGSTAIASGWTMPMTLAQQPSADEAATQTSADEPSQASDQGDEANLMAMDPATFIWELVLFVILLAVLAKFVWPPILHGLQQREVKIRGDLEQAEQASKEATATLNEYQKQVADARKEAQQIIERSRADAQKTAAQIKEQGQADLKQMRERAQADIEAAQQQAVAEIYEQTAALATQVAGQILQREIQPEDHRALVERSLEGLAARRN